MKNLIASIAIATLLPSLASAGEVFGVLKSDASPVAGAQVAAKCGANAYGPVTSDAKGNYRLVINQTGKCTLTVTHEGRSATVDVVSFDDAAQADIVLKVDGGKLTARRG